MNKKLFSWKALAGLALLVAMGLTSCNNNTVVDPNDPYNTTKPTQPSTSTKGGDLVFTVTKTADLASLWASYDATKKAELMKKTTLNIVINSGAYKLDGATLTLPAFFNTPANSVLNLTFNGSFQDADKQPLVLDASTNLSGAKVNIVVPGQAFDMTLDATNVAATLASEGTATIGKFQATANANKANALSINSGVTINAIDENASGAIVKDGGDIKAVIIASDKTIANGKFVTKKGVAIGSELYTTNLIVNAAGVTVTNDKDTPLGDIIINKNCNLTLGFADAKYGSVTGTKASESKLTINNVTLNGTAYKNVEVVNAIGWVVADKDIFDGVKLSNFVSLTASSLSNVELGGSVNIFFDASNKTFAFNNVAIPAGFSINVDGGIKVPLTPTKTTYQWDIANNTWVEVTAAAPISAANASDSGIEVSSDDVSFWNSTTGAYDYSKIQSGADKVGTHKVFTIVTENNNWIQPENCSLTIDAKSTFAGAAIIDNNINSAVTWAGTIDPVWFNVKAGNDTYTWKKGTLGWTLVK